MTNIKQKDHTINSKIPKFGVKRISSKRNIAVLKYKHFQRNVWIPDNSSQVGKQLEMGSLHHCYATIDFFRITQILSRNSGNKGKLDKSGVNSAVVKIYKI